MIISKWIDGCGETLQHKWIRFFKFYYLNESLKNLVQKFALGNFHHSWLWRMTRNYWKFIFFSRQSSRHDLQDVAHYSKIEWILWFYLIASLFNLISYYFQYAVWTVISYKSVRVSEKGKFHLCLFIIFLTCYQIVYSTSQFLYSLLYFIKKLSNFHNIFKWIVSHWMNVRAFVIINSNVFDKFTWF